MGDKIFFWYVGNVYFFITKYENMKISFIDLREMGILEIGICTRIDMQELFVKL